MYSHYKNIFYSSFTANLYVLLPGFLPSQPTEAETWAIVFNKIQLVVYYKCYILIGWATTRLYVIAH